jgi:hypothetical protein
LFVRQLAEDEGFVRHRRLAGNSIMTDRFCAAQFARSTRLNVSSSANWLSSPGTPLNWAGSTQAERIEASVAILNRGVYAPMEHLVSRALLSTRQAVGPGGKTEA